MLNFDDFSDNINDSYEIICEEYSGTELYIEIIHLMNLAFPEWRSHSGIGNGAPDFILENLEHYQETLEHSSQRQWLITLYLGLADSYWEAKDFYNDSFKAACDEKVAAMDLDEFESEFGKQVDQMSDEELNNCFKDFWLSKIDEIPYDFKFNDEEVVLLSRI